MDLRWLSRFLAVVDGSLGIHWGFAKTNSSGSSFVSPSLKS